MCFVTLHEETLFLPRAGLKRVALDAISHRVQSERHALKINFKYPTNLLQHITQDVMTNYSSNAARRVTNLSSLTATVYISFRKTKLFTKFLIYARVASKLRSKHTKHNVSYSTIYLQRAFIPVSRSLQSGVAEVTKLFRF